MGNQPPYGGRGGGGGSNNYDGNCELETSKRLHS